MANDILLKSGTAILLGHSADYNPSANNILIAGGITIELDLTSLAALSARQSAKFDFGSTRAERYKITAALEFATAPIAGETVDFYLAFSPQATAAVGNPGGVSGSDSAYAGYSANLDASIKQITFVGAFPLTVQATTDVQKCEIGVFVPTHRYATLIVDNRSAGDALHSDADEMSVLIEPFPRTIVEV